MSVKIGDVARLAGVSVPVVSRVINKSKYVSPELEMRVLEAVKTLKYIPNDNARALASKKSNAIGLIIPFLNDSNSSFLNSCSLVLDSFNYDLMIGKSSGNKNRELEILDIHLNSMISGIILVSSTFPRKAEDMLKRYGVPVVFAYVEAPELRFHSRIFDNAKAAFTLVRSIREVDNKKVAILSGPLGEIIMKHRIEGCLKALGGSRRENIFECDGTLDGSYDKTFEILKSGRPDILICLNDFMAIGALRSLYNKGISVPADMEVTGFEGTTYSEASTPSLATVKFDDHLLGTITAETILGLIGGKEIETFEVLDFHIVPGESCLLI